MKILVIEDEAEMRDVIVKSLQQEKFLVETAADFSSGYDKITTYDYDCILLDINLPGGNGITLLEELRKMKKQESVIIVSAKNSVDDKVKGLDLGADEAGLTDGRADLGDLYRLIKPELRLGPPLEVDSHIDPPDEGGGDTGNRDDQRDRVEDPSLAEEVDVRITEELHVVCL